MLGSHEQFIDHNVIRKDERDGNSESGAVTRKENDEFRIRREPKSSPSII